MNQTEEKTMFKNAGRVKRTIEEYFVLTVATFILVVGVYVFKFPNNFSFGGVTGIAVVLSAIMPTTPGNITFIINQQFEMFKIHIFFSELNHCDAGFNSFLYRLGQRYTLKPPSVRDGVEF